MGITAKRIIDQAASKIGVKGRGMDLATDELRDWMEGLAQMLDGWGLEELMIPYVTRETFTLSKQQSFTIGTAGGDFNTVRPLEILSVELIDGAGETYWPTRVPLNTWIMTQDDVEGRPQRWYYENGYPLATLHFDLIPYDPQVRIVSRKPIVGVETVAGTTTTFQTVDFIDGDLANLLTEVEFDRGYMNALIFNLAIHMAPDYNKMPSSIVLGLAEKFKRDIKNQNLEVPNLSIEGGLQGGGGYYDIVAGP